MPEGDTQKPANRSISAATDVPEFISDLDGGVFERALSVALSQTAAAAIDFSKKGEVSIKLSIEQIAGTHQVRIAHTLKFLRPTSTGKVGEEFTGASVLHVGQYGALSLAQPSLLERESRQQTRIPGA